MDGSYAGTADCWAGHTGAMNKQIASFEGNQGLDQCAAVTADNGKILAVGTTGSGQFALVRYLDEPNQLGDGDLDSTFGTGGKVTTAFAGSATARAVALDSANAGIVVAGVMVDGIGDTEVALARYHDADGSLDTNFGTGGMVTTDLGTGWSGTSTVAVESDGCILVAGTYNGQFALLHYNANGTPDTNFGTDGMVLTTFGGSSETPSAMTLDSNGKILLAGTTTQSATGKDFAMARYNANGSLDTSFGTGGLVTTDFSGNNDVASAITVQSDGKIVLAGYSEDASGNDSFALVRYNTSGSLDTSFGTGGLVTTGFGDGHDRATGVAIDATGGIIISGTSFLNSTGQTSTHAHFALLRMNSNGALDSSFGSGTVLGGVTTDFSDLGFTSESATGFMVDSTGASSPLARRARTTTATLPLPATTLARRPLPRRSSTTRRS